MVADNYTSSPQILNEDTVMFAAPNQGAGGRPTAANFSGKYTSCTNKNDSLSFQANKRMVTIRAINNVSQTEFTPTPQ